MSSRGWGCRVEVCRVEVEDVLRLLLKTKESQPEYSINILIKKYINQNLMHFQKYNLLSLELSWGILSHGRLWITNTISLWNTFSFNWKRIKWSLKCKKEKKIFAFIHFSTSYTQLKSFGWSFNNRTWACPILTLGCPYFFHITKKLDRLNILFVQKWNLLQ